MIYKEIIKKKESNKKLAVDYYLKKDDNWKKVMDSTSKLINYIMVMKQN